MHGPSSVDAVKSMAAQVAPPVSVGLTQTGRSPQSAIVVSPALKARLFDLMMRWFGRTVGGSQIPCPERGTSGPHNCMREADNANELRSPRPSESSACST